LEEILYSDGTTTFPGSGRNDLLVLSSDGAVVVHHQRSWGGGRDWATLTRTTDGEVLGAIPGAQSRLDVVPIPGGHVMAVTTGEHLWVLGQDYEFYAYEGLTNHGLLVDRQLVVWNETYRQLFVFEPATGFRSEAVFVDESEAGSRPRVVISPNRSFFAVDFRMACEMGTCVKTLLHDVVEEQTTVLFDGEGDVSTRYVTDDGMVLAEGIFRRPDGVIYERDVRIFSPTGEVLEEIEDRNLGRTESAGGAVFVQTFDVMFGSARLDRVDAVTGTVTPVLEDLSDFRVAGDRLYYLTLPDEMGMAQLVATPISSGG
jgi:hypothetical protein